MIRSCEDALLTGKQGNKGVSGLVFCYLTYDLISEDETSVLLTCLKISAISVCI